MKNASSIIRSTLLSVLFTLVAVLVFAGVVKAFELSDDVILFVNQIIKALCVGLGCFFGLKGPALPLRGMVAGALSTFTAYTLFTLLSAESFFRLSLLWEVLFGLAVGFAAGIICKICKKTAQIS